MTTPAIPQDQPFFGIQRMFLKGQSLELPQGAQVFLQQNPPAMNINVQVDSAVLADNLYEVSLRATLTAELDGKTLYLLEATQAGIFEVRNMTPEQLADILEIAAPGMIAPYLRTQLSDTLARATLPLFWLPELNWAAMAMQRRAEAAAQEQKPALMH